MHYKPFNKDQKQFHASQHNNLDNLLFLHKNPIYTQNTQKTPLNPMRDVNKKALCKTRNPVVCFV